MSAESSVMEQIVSLCKRRGFVYPASEIYGGLNGFWDYGPLGVLLKNNIRDWWWRNMVECPPVGPDGHPVDIVGLDSAIIQNPRTWEASGHVAGFTDPRVDDTETKKRYRADHLYAMIVDDGQHRLGVTAVVGGDVQANEWAQALSDPERRDQVRNTLSSKARKRLSSIGGGAAFHYKLVRADQLSEADRKVTYAPEANEPGTLTEARQFNLMFESETGAVSGETIKVYLRPETAQGIFLQYKNVLDTTRVKVPFGIAQVGKSFRNEVTPRNFIFRSREFEQMEMEWFCHPDEALKWYEFWRAERMRWWESLGVRREYLQFRDHDEKELAFYSKATVDIEYRYPFTTPDFGELEGIAHRGDYDLSQHIKHSGNKLDYFDQDLQLQLKAQGLAEDEVKRRSRYVPNVIEPASGLTRAVLVLLCEAFTPDESRPSKMYMKFHPKFAPIKCGVYPLVNKDGMPERAERIYLHLRQHLTCEYDAKQAIGKRYARNDEIGTPFCLTVDGQTLQDGTVTVRHRDTMQQERVAEDNLLSYLQERLRA